VESNPNAALTAAIERLWVQFLPQMHERVDTLATAAGSVAAGTLSPEKQQQAQAAAHKLAGSLGTFGLTRGTELAHELEIAYARRDCPDPLLAEWLANVAAQLRMIVDSR
jgi:HPt (histidine-containing phosphotransfer) domain-containing protein